MAREEAERHGRMEAIKHHNSEVDKMEAQWQADAARADLLRTTMSGGKLCPQGQGQHIHTYIHTYGHTYIHT